MENQKKSNFKDKVITLQEIRHKEINEIINSHYPHTNNFMSFDEKHELIKNIERFEYLNLFLEEAKKQELKEEIWQSIYENFSVFPKNASYILSEEEMKKWGSVFFPAIYPNEESIDKKA